MFATFFSQEEYVPGFRPANGTKPAEENKAMA
jgi:hypothetical protein